MTHDDDNGEDLRVRAAIYGEDGLNALDQWRLRNLRDQEQRAQAAERQQRNKQRDEIEQLRVEVWNEIAQLRDEIEQRREQQAEIIGTALGEYGNKLLDDFERFTRNVQRELITLVETRFAQLQARIDNAGATSRVKEFRFANEPRDAEPVDLPSGFLRKVLN